MTNGQGELIAELDYNGIIRGATLDNNDIELESSPPQPTCDQLSDKPSGLRNIHPDPCWTAIYGVC
jgi:hypothetical protein